MSQRIAQWLRFPEQAAALDFIAPLLLRLYLAPIMWLAGVTKLNSFESTVEWFGNPDWGLGLPFPYVMAGLATWTEILGGLALLLGFAVRWVSLPLMATMLVAAVTVHLKHGWQAIADPVMCLFNCNDAEAASERLAQAKSILREHGNYEWLTEQGSFAVVNNGIEFAATYFLMLFVLFFIGAGRYFSLDHWIARALGRGSAVGSR
ncbi:HvfX family Cu-binding RiPP maturation protein [Polycyclovorans algicola]|uniref:HvfX family Cu-binding RiPP maturation protein n=1 Tax=Polycyclovorans algicola TaxID=616992 RepID=UPI0005BCAD46|nr:DoxX family protein [Polycyclovorans algicola]